MSYVSLPPLTLKVLQEMLIVLRPADLGRNSSSIAAWFFGFFKSLWCALSRLSTTHDPAAAAAV
jgi:hypothetical protein